MAKTASVFIRVEPDLKVQVESVLERLGLPMASAIALFFNQIVLQQGIPFALKAAAEKPLSYEALSEEQFGAEIQKGIDDLDAGRYSSAADVRAGLRGKYGV
ncbi:MAG: type II toxin-antitoxin system RelB/DinJ family antitoxin [Oscillospiraceae bacterium]|jgi:addiction module RelB/DinJ family antitoxin|nr:type II toxin-antitoxin system RelB/DinJ family antitoxin [Oscillospiraceae bacterium]